MPELMKQISFAKLDEGMEMPHLLDIQTRAFESLTPKQIDLLDDYVTLFHFDLSTIEGNGGGSARCMMAEIHLPLK